MYFILIIKEIKSIGRSDDDFFPVISLIAKSFTSFLDDCSNAFAHRLNYIVDRGYRKVFIVFFTLAGNCSKFSLVISMSRASSQVVSILNEIGFQWDSDQDYELAWKTSLRRPLRMLVLQLHCTCFEQDHRPGENICRRHSRFSKIFVGTARERSRQISLRSSAQRTDRKLSPPHHMR